MRGLFLLIDAILRRKQNIAAFWDDPGCVLRINLRAAPRPLPLDGNVVRPGTKVLELHLWNEHLPQVGASDSSLAWAVKGHAALVRSLAALAQHVEQRADLADVPAVFGITTFMSQKDAQTAERVLARLGFAQTAYRSSLGAFGDFWENLYAWFLYRTFRRSAPRKPLLGMRRKLLWMSKEELVRRYARRGSRPGAARRPRARAVQ
jgi:hypothetical protein